MAAILGLFRLGLLRCWRTILRGRWRWRCKSNWKKRPCRLKSMISESVAMAEIPLGSHWFSDPALT